MKESTFQKTCIFSYRNFFQKDFLWWRLCGNLLHFEKEAGFSKQAEKRNFEIFPEFQIFKKQICSKNSFKKFNIFGLTIDTSLLKFKIFIMYLFVLKYINESRIFFWILVFLNFSFSAFLSIQKNFVHKKNIKFVSAYVYVCFAQIPALSLQKRKQKKARLNSRLNSRMKSRKKLQFSLYCSLFFVFSLNVLIQSIFFVLFSFQKIRKYFERIKKRNQISKQKKIKNKFLY